MFGILLDTLSLTSVSPRPCEKCFLIFVFEMGHECFFYNDTKINKKDKTGNHGYKGFPCLKSSPVTFKKQVCYWPGPDYNGSGKGAGWAVEGATELAERFKSSKQLPWAIFHLQRKKTKTKWKLNSQPGFHIISNKNWIQQLKKKKKKKKSHKFKGLGSWSLLSFTHA